MCIFTDKALQKIEGVPLEAIEGLQDTPGTAQHKLVLKEEPPRIGDIIATLEKIVSAASGAQYQSHCID